MFHIRSKIGLSTKAFAQSDFKTFVNKYKESINQISFADNISASLEKINIKLASSKRDTPLIDLGTINVIDSQKAELTTFDPQLTKYVVSSLQSAGMNLTVTTLTPSKLLIISPKQTSSNKKFAMEQLKKRTDQIKNEIRDVRRDEINNFRISTKDKDEIRNFEIQIQKKFENTISEIDKEFESILKKFSK